MFSLLETREYVTLQSDSVQEQDFSRGVGRATSWFAHCHLRGIHRSRDGKCAREYLMLQAWPSRALWQI